MEKIYCIKNTTDEWGTLTTVGFYSTYEKALEEVKKCRDWYRPKGTGHIYEVTLDTWVSYDLIWEM